MVSASLLISKKSRPSNPVNPLSKGEGSTTFIILLNDLVNFLFSKSVSHQQIMTVIIGVVVEIIVQKMSKGIATSVSKTQLDSFSRDK